jgi:hypothetical protein
MELQCRIVRDVTGSALHGTSDGRCVATHTVMYVTCDAPRCVRHGAVCVSHSCVALRSRPTIGADVLPCVPIGAACRPGLFRQAACDRCSAANKPRDLSRIAECLVRSLHMRGREYTCRSSGRRWSRRRHSALHTLRESLSACGRKRTCASSTHLGRGMHASGAQM